MLDLRSSFVASSSHVFWLLLASSLYVCDFNEYEAFMNIYENLDISMEINDHLRKSMNINKKYENLRNSIN